MSDNQVSINKHDRSEVGCKIIVIFMYIVEVYLTFRNAESGGAAESHGCGLLCVVTRAAAGVMQPFTREMDAQPRPPFFVLYL